MPSKRKTSKRKTSKRKTSKRKTSKRKTSKRKMNAYFTLMNAARKGNKKMFLYKGKTYKQAKTKNGMVIYKKSH